VTDDTQLPMSADQESRIQAIEHAIVRALPDGWELSRCSMWWVNVSVEPGFEWVASSGRYDVGFFQLRLTEDLRTLLISPLHRHPLPASGH
jgi:hypothetical protein